jgi:hypothetical protein
MTYKDLGPFVSQSPQAVLPGGGPYTAEDHSWESLVLQQDKPATDWEMNLLQEVLGRGGVTGLASKLLPSCFMTNTFVDESNVLGDYIFYTPGPITITGAADDGFGLIEITTLLPHGLSNGGNSIIISGVTGTIEANGLWFILSTGANTFTLTGSVFVNVYLAGGIALVSIANKLRLRASEVLVNGWQVRFDLTELATPGVNRITLPVPPLTGVRTDLVILEVWRALVSPLPDISNKSPSGQILRYGNAKASDGPPFRNENLSDDLLDPTFLSETAKRVQIQYRYRVIPGIDIETYPDGLEDPNVLAHTVPYLTASDVDGAELITYPYVRDSFDNGLWITGENNSVGALALGTVDGLMYAVPVCAIARRNSGGFDRVTNVNGGVLMTSLTSDRPDGLYADQIVVGDLLDLRRGVAWDFNEVLDKTFQEVLDNTLTTRMDVSGPCVGTSIFVKDELAFGSKMGQPDGVRTSFSDRRITESAVAMVPIVAPSAIVVVNLSAFTVPWAGSPVDLTLTSPTGVTLSSVTKVRVWDGVGTDYDALLGGSPAVLSVALTISGIYVDTAIITFDAPVAAGLTLFVEVLIDYPSNSGASRNIVSPHALWTPPAANIAAWVDPSVSTFQTTSDLNRNALYGDTAYPGPLWKCDPTHREITARLRTTVQNWTAIADGISDVMWVPDVLDPNVTPTLSMNITGATDDGFGLIEITTSSPHGLSNGNSIIISGVTGTTEANGAWFILVTGANTFTLTGSVFVNAYLAGGVVQYVLGGYAISGSTLWTTFTSITLSSVPALGTQIIVTYQARRPLPPLQAIPGDSYQFFYQSRSIQSNVVPAGISTLHLVPRAIGKSLHSILTGSGSPDSGFPFVSPSEQIPVGLVPGPASESALNSPSSVSVLGMNVNTGYVTVPVVIPYTPDASKTTLFSNVITTTDSEGRNFWPQSSLLGSIYGPTSIGPLLSSKIRHKVALPVLMEVKQDLPSGLAFQFRKGTLVLVVFTNWVDFGNENTIDLSSDLSSSCAAVYRVRGNLMNHRRTV